MQKLRKLYAVNPELLKVLTFKPRIGQSIALQASTAVWNSALVLPSQFIQLLFLFLSLEPTVNQTYFWHVIKCLCC